uniref:Doublecortin domain-containing protein n=1 Tax=Strongyloides papillosus TaxID=174720 RepID=A0A0N5B8Q3_STREA
MSIERKILECVDDIKRLKPGEAFAMSFEIGYYDNEKLDSFVTSISSGKLNKKKKKNGTKLGKCYRDKYVGKDINEIRDKLCTNTNLIVQGSVLSTKIVKILDNLKKKRNLLYSSQEYTDTHVTTDGYSLRELSSGHKNNFVNYKDILSSEKKIHSSLYDDGKKIKSKYSERKNIENEETTTTDLTSTTTTVSFYTSNDKPSMNQSDVTSGASSKIATPKTLETTDLKNLQTLQTTAVTSTSTVLSAANKYCIKPISRRLNKKIAKLIENEEKKRRNNEMAKEKEKKINKASLKVLSSSSNVQSEDVSSLLDSTQREKTASVNSSSQVSTANQIDSTNDKASDNNNVINKNKPDKEVVVDKKSKENSPALPSVKTVESPKINKDNDKSNSTSNTPTVETVTAISIKDYHINPVVEKKVENPEISSNAVQSNLSSVQTAQLPPHIQEQNNKASPL